MNIIISTDDMRRSFTLNLRGWRTPVALVLIGAAVALGIYQGAFGLASRWAESGDEKVRWMIDEIRRKADAERDALWHGTVDRLDQEVVNLQVQLWRLGALGNAIAERMGMDAEVMIELPAAPDTGASASEAATDASDPATDAGEPASETSAPASEASVPAGDAGDAGAKIGALDSQLFELGEAVAVEELRIEEIGANTSYAAMRRATVPVAQPLEGRFWRTSGYGNRKDPFTGRQAFHAGYDFAARTGTPVLAAAAGIVTYRGRLGNYGKTVEIYHGSEISTLYGHLSDYRVENGEFVERGQVIALVGSTGRSTGPHLHYEIRRADRPRPYSRAFKEIVAARPEIAALPSAKDL